MQLAHYTHITHIPAFYLLLKSLILILFLLLLFDRNKVTSSVQAQKNGVLARTMAALFDGM